MTDKEGRTELLISDTLVPDIFITQYAQELSKDALCMYLWLLMTHKEQEFSKEDIREFSILSDNDSDRAAAELVSHELLFTKDNKTFRIVDLKKNEVDSYVKSMIDRGNSTSSLKLCADEESRNVLAGSINKTFYLGNMSYMFYRLVDKCLYDYGFDPTVVYSLFEEGREQKIHLKQGAMYEMASNWSRNGYLTPDDLKRYYDRKSRREQLISLMGRLARKRINGLDIERIDRWVDEYKTTPELADYAFRVNDFRDKITIRNVDEKLREWYAAGIESIDQAQVYENERRVENKKAGARKRARNDNPNKTWDELVGAAQKSKPGYRESDKEDSVSSKTNDKAASDNKADNKNTKDKASEDLSKPAKKTAKKPAPEPEIPVVAEEESEPETDEILGLFGGIDEDGK